MGRIVPRASESKRIASYVIANDRERIVNSAMRVAGQSSVRSAYRFRVTPELRREAAHLNISQNELARLCRISSGHMSQLFSGKRTAGPQVRRRIMRVFPNMAFEDLFQDVSLEPGQA